MRVPILLLLWVAALSVHTLVPAQENPVRHLDRITVAKAVRVCIWPDYYSITYRDPRTQVLSGIDIDMARELGKEGIFGNPFMENIQSIALLRGLQ